MKLYYVTDAAEAAALLRDGFRDADPKSGMTSTGLGGVLVNDEPLSVYEDARRNQLIEVVMPDSTPLENELLEDDKGYREWCVPAHMLNEWPWRRLDMTDVETLEAIRVRQLGPSADLLAELVRARGNPFGEDEERTASDDPCPDRTEGVSSTNFRRTDPGR